MIHEEIIWAQKHRPAVVSACILPKNIKVELQGMVDSGSLPNLILSGPPGTGKTTVAKAICEQLGFDYIVLNGSGEDRGIDAIKQKVTRFATTMSFDGSKKAVIVDEGDNLTHDAQLAMRAVMESVSKNCMFIFTCNYVGRIIDALKSRAAIIDFNSPSAERTSMAVQFFKRCCTIIEAEGVEYDKKAVQQIVMDNYPDFRRTINSLQRAATSGKIDAESITRVDEFAPIIEAVKTKNFPEMRKLIAESSLSPQAIFNRFSSDGGDLYANDNVSWAQSYLFANEHDEKSSFVADQQINIVAFLLKIMSKCAFK